MQKTHKNRLTRRNFLACFTFYIQVPNKARYSTLVEKLLVHRKWDRLVIYWHALIVEEISNVDVKCVKVTAAQNVGKGHRDKVSAVEVSRRNTMQGLVVVGPIVEQISNVDVQCFKVTGVRNIGQGQWIKLPTVSTSRKSTICRQGIEKKHYAMFGRCKPYTWGDIKRRRKMCQIHCSAKYRSRSPGQGTCRVNTSRKSTMQGLMVLGHIFEEISSVDVNCVNVTGAQNIGRVHRVKKLAESVHRGQALSKVWWLYAV